MSTICSGIVTYYPDILRLKQNISAVANQVDRVYIVDNHSNNLLEIREMIREYEKIELIENDNNLGIAAALNQLCERAKDVGYEWILTLDQDTIIPNRMIEKFMPYTYASDNGIICPAVEYEGWEERITDTETTEYVYACMTSASLTSIKAWETVQGYREDYFIDFVDNEFCMKLSLNNYRILRVNSCHIKHKLGDAGIKNICGLKVRYSRHSPLRLYYMARNNYAFIKEYKDRLSVGKEKLKLQYVLLIAVLFSDEKSEAIRSIRRGIKDAKTGVFGEYKK